MQERDKYLLSEFKKALRKDANASFSNLDDLFTEKFDFFAQRYEEIMKVTGQSIPPHRWSYHRIGIMTDGQADYTCGIYRFKAIKNTLINIPARTITTSEWSPDGKGFTILFKTDFLLQNNLSYRSLENKSILQPSSQPFLQLTDSQAAQVCSIFETILSEKNTGDGFKNELIAIKIVELMILCERFYGEVLDIQQNEKSIDLISRFSELTDKHFAEERSVTFYAAQLHVHPNYLNSVVKANTGITAKESIQNRLILEAKYLLHTTNMSVKEIANALGFEDPNYFNAFFKRIENTSPLAYRSQFV